VKTVIIVKTKILVNHWCGYLEKYRISHLGSFDGVTALLKNFVNGTVSIPDVLVIVSRHVENEEFLNFLTLNYSFCLIDEIHSWSLTEDSAMSKFIITTPFAINIYLTATPNKEDIPVYGQIIKAMHPPDFNSMKRIIVNYQKRDTSIVTIEEPLTSDFSDEPLDTIQLDPVRNSVIVTCILELLASCTIVYCNRRKHVDLLFNSLLRSIRNIDIVDNLEVDDVTISFSMLEQSYKILKGDAKHSDIHGKIKDLSNHRNFTLITTVQFCACGLDLPAITNVILALTSVESNTLKQAVGRAERAPYNTDRRVVMRVKLR
jgi:superfamily II DNA or RNA helicase